MAPKFRAKTSGNRAGTLLAKPDRTLAGHTQDVANAFVALFGRPDSPTDLCGCWLRFFRCPSERAFLINGLIAAFCHDWGKANDGFLRMLERRGVQLLRHEQISAMLVNQPGIRDWLRGNSDIDLSLVLAAVVGHHLKARAATFGQPESSPEGIVRLRWEELRQQFIGTVVDVPNPVIPPLDVPAIWSFRPGPGMADLASAMREVRDRLESLGDELEADEPRRRLLWAVRAALIAADSAGSGLYRTRNDITAWVESAFDPGSRLDGQGIWRKVIEPRLQQIGGRWRGWNEFQEACGDPGRVPARAILLAPCGSGKTLAAWRWIAARCAERPVGRVVFLYPTRGTATEGYRDYASHAGPEEAALVHGTADLDVDTVHPDLAIEGRIQEARLFALRQWPKRIFSGTVDQFLGFLQHSYGPTCLLPMLADSVIVVDEVHSYDRGMFSALLQFLQNFDVPVLAMTATLLQRRREQLARGGATLGGRGLAVIDGLSLGGEGDELRSIADHPRYQITGVPDCETAMRRVREALASDEPRRVLWVVNTVDRAQEIARQFASDPKAESLITRDGVPVFCYHSRYRLVDRRQWHQQVVDTFRPADGRVRRVLAVTTQVCEISLDLDADFLVTEYAPATSLVQRLGRCCRDLLAHRSDRRGEVVLYEPRNEDGRRCKAPYTDREMEGCDELVARLLSAKVVSQSDLEDFLGGLPHTAELPRECRFIESGPWASSGEENFRDGDDYTRQSLLPRDVEDYLRWRDEPASWRSQELILPVPSGMIDRKKVDQRLPSWLRIADARNASYLPALGYCRDERPDSYAIV